MSADFHTIRVPENQVLKLVTFGFDYLHEDIRKVTVCKALFSWNQLHPQSANITRRSSTSIRALLYRCFELVKQ